METIDSMRKENFSDWMAIHGFSYDDLIELQRVFPRQTQSYDQEVDNTILEYSEKEAWDLCAAALAQILPRHRKSIYMFRDSIPFCLSDQNAPHKQPYVIDRGSKSLPSIHCEYEGNASSLTKMAHEFTHAIQIIISQNYSKQKPFMPPLYRECCAFLGEIALTEYSKSENPKIYELLKKSWFNDNLIYLSTDVEAFKLALEDTDRSYSYRWNYPVARLFAVFLWKDKLKSESTETVTTLFESGENAVTIIPFKTLQASLDASNLKPTFYRSDTTGSKQLGKYEILGVIASLCMSDKKQKNQTFIEFYNEISKHINDESLFVYFLGSKPSGYALWNKKDATSKKVRLTEFYNPFCSLETFTKFMEIKLDCEIEMPLYSIHLAGISQEIHE